MYDVGDYESVLSLDEVVMKTDSQITGRLVMGNSRKYREGLEVCVTRG